MIPKHGCFSVGIHPDARRWLEVHRQADNLFVLRCFDAPSSSETVTRPMVESAVPTFAAELARTHNWSLDEASWIQRPIVEAARVEFPKPQRNVYFVECGDFVKIGWCSGDPIRRLSELQNGNPHRMSLLGTMRGGPREEAALHRRFSELRGRGEWFRKSSALLDLIQAVKS
jgi:hypothetical protein